MTDNHVHDWQETSTGGSHMSGGDYSDDTRDYLVCSECGEEIDQLPAVPAPVEILTF